MVDRPENILVEFDYNNIIVVDPNKVINEQGVAQQRLVRHEDLVIYANLETKVLPRTKLAVGVANNDIMQTVSIATINFLKPGGNTFLDTKWTDELTGKDAVKGEGVNQPKQTSIKNPNKDDDFYIRQTIQSGGKFGAVDNGLLGITSIYIKADTSFMPTIDIEMIDVKGRALFESGDNSPYATFFNLPYPLFTLTIKGYYGKAVKLPIMLVDFKARYEQEGNFRINLKFYTYKYTILSELTMAALVAAPHMYKTRISRQSSSGGSAKTVPTQEIVTERGYQKIKEMYSEYKSKGLVPDDLPELTLVQLRESLNTFITTKLNTFTKENLEPISGCDDYQKDLNEYQGVVYNYTSGRISWFNKYMDKENFYVLNDKQKTKIYTFRKELNSDDLRLAAVTELEAIINEFNTKLDGNPVVGKNGITKDKPYSYKIGSNKYTVQVPNPITSNVFNISTSYTSIDAKETYFQRTGKQLLKESSEEKNFLSKLEQTYTLNSNDTVLKTGGKTRGNRFFFFEGLNSFIDLTDKMNKELKVIREEIEQQLTEALSSLIENKNEGIGFVPNIRNVLAMVFANGEAFLRMMDDVHTKAWDLRNDKDRKKVILDQQTAGASEETFNSGDIANTPIYPWPQYIVETTGEDGHEKYELRYPGDASLVSKTKGYLYNIWPEIEFVEEFVNGFTERDTPPAERKNSNEVSDIKRISINAIEFPIGNNVFSNQEEVKFFYEIYERIIYIINFSKISRVEDTPSFIDPIIKFISESEKTNVKNALDGGSPFIVDKLKNYIISSGNFESLLRQFSNNGVGESWQNFVRGIFNTPYIRNQITNGSFEFLNSNILGESISQPQITLTSEVEFEKFLTSNTNKKFDFTDTFPFTNKNWVKKYLAQSESIETPESAFVVTEILKYNTTNKVIANFLPTTPNIFGKPFTIFAQKNNTEPQPINRSSQTTAPTNDMLKSFYNRPPKDQILTEGTIRYLNYSGGVNFEQTTSILNTPYFINSIQDGLKKFRNYDKNPFVSSAYYLINSLPLATLKEKYLKYENGTNILQDYIFATIKKFGAIHKLPYAWILKYGSIWHRYKKFIESGVDILDESWKDFDRVPNYDPITSAATKTYNLTIDNTPYDIVLETNTIIGLETSTLLNVGFYPKLINDFSVFFNGYELITSQINGTCNVSGTTLTVTQISSNGLQVGSILAGVNLLSDTTIVSQIDGTPGGIGKYQVSPTQTGSTGLFSVVNVPSNNYTSATIQNVLDNSGLTMNYVNNAIIDYNATLPIINAETTIRVIPWSLAITTNDGNFMYLLPSSGTLFNQTKNECFGQNNTIKQPILGNSAIYNGSVRLFWTAPNYGYFDNSRVKKILPEEYLKMIKTGDTFQDAFTITGLNNEYAKMDEMFSVFEKDVLDKFENEFLKFSKSIYDANEFSDDTEIQITNSAVLTDTPLTKSFRNFQGLMRTMLRISNTTGSTGYEFVSKAQTAQFINVQDILGKFLEFDVVFKYGNPSNYNRRLFTSFSTLPIVDKVEWNKYTTNTPNALPTLNGVITLANSQNNYIEAWAALFTYVGFSEIPELKYKNSGSYITDFFIDLNVEFTPENVKLLAPIIKIYATQKLNQFQSNYIPPPNPTNQILPTLVAVADLRSGDTINVQQLETKFRTTFTNKDGVLLFESEYSLPPNNDVYTTSGSEIYYKSLINNTIIGIFGSTTTTPTDAQFIILFEQVTPVVYRPTPSSISNIGSSPFLIAMTNYLNKINGFRDKIVNSLMIDIRNSLDNIKINFEEQISSAIQGEPQPKLELWEMFKALNDKWIAGNDFKTKTLFEDVLLMDRASRNVGDKILVDIDKLNSLLKTFNPKNSMLSMVQTILVENNFMVMNIPSYVNFYGVQDSVKNPKPRIESTLDFANTLFGTFTSVDYRDSTSKMVCFYGGKPSGQLDLKENVDFRKRSDAFDLRRASDNPLVENLIGKNDWDKSNRVVGFNVDIGPQNQGIFNTFSVGQDSGVATSESLEINNQLANQGNNRAGATQSTSLYNLYKNRSYTCSVSMMGNALIQPTMYFNLRNVPMFSGPYMILSVNHQIRPGSFTTSFEGIRQPIASLPKIDNFLLSLKQKLLQSIIEKNRQEKNAEKAKEKNNVVAAKSSSFEVTVNSQQNCSAGTKYNTYVVEPPIVTLQTLQDVINKIIARTDSVLLRYCMFARIYFYSGGETIIEGYGHNYSAVNLVEGQDWGPSSARFASSKEYSKKFFCDSKGEALAYFDSLDKHLDFMFDRWKDVPNSLKLQNTVTDISKFVIVTNESNYELGKNFYKSLAGAEPPTTYSDGLKEIENIVKTSIDVYNSVLR
jgi:hypothetical protein